MTLTKEDAHTIEQYIRLAHGGYTGPVGIWMDRLVDLHMSYSRMIVSTAIVEARYESKGKA
ncbi:hypothetical protein LU604_07085 [Erwinia tracheiphila]|uniref:Uncharacterized protein n=1 Tax=Erwinia tracheiphila TaxID=65700 RepID=A0A345CT64_9GAMM|nr:hypothetical protein [Erwinia tracheiphila]AXF76631.1 hypothetical protein AV903_12220 [Erwinia tracheiphila]UIA84698.1 hypothetical protein LU604_07085 [Erwinia tracheiphila]UIA93290.1 hypothetical protein LU632_07060 [Erwinia tracheiphila]